MGYLLFKIGFSTSKNGQVPIFMKFHKETFYILNFLCALKIQDGDLSGGSWLIWVNFQMLITLEPVGVRS